MRAKFQKIGILWSGGLDSTYLAWHYLAHNPHLKVKGHYILLANNELKTIAERQACERLAEVFQVMFKGRFEWEIILSHDLHSSANGLTFKQLPFWLLSALWIDQVDAIAIGYVMNDDAVSYVSDIKKAWKALQFIRMEPVRLEFPLTKVKKAEMVGHLPQEFKQHLWWCENPHGDRDHYEPCHHCPACQHSPFAALEKKANNGHPGAVQGGDRPRDGVPADLEVSALRTRFLTTPER